ncbi:hypothetical protein JTE90_011601, partial [Oedothorax gibbosus]
WGKRADEKGEGERSELVLGVVVVAVLRLLYVAQCLCPRVQHGGHRSASLACSSRLSSLRVVRPPCRAAPS